MNPNPFQNSNSQPHSTSPLSSGHTPNRSTYPHSTPSFGATTSTPAPVSPLSRTGQTTATGQSTGGQGTGGQGAGGQGTGTLTENRPLSTTATTPTLPTPEPTSRLAVELSKFNEVASELRSKFQARATFEERCEQAFDIANDLFGNAPTWVCFYRELLGGSGMIHQLFHNNDEYGRFLRTDQYHQIQMMLTGLRSRDLPENDPNDPQRMITVRLPKSLHEAMCEEAGRLNISVNRLCISRMLQLLDPKMIPETHSKPRGRKPRTRAKQGS